MGTTFLQAVTLAQKGCAALNCSAGANDDSLALPIKDRIPQVRPNKPGLEAWPRDAYSPAATSLFSWVI